MEFFRQGDGRWHLTYRSEVRTLGLGGMAWGKRESPGAYDYQGLGHGERDYCVWLAKGRQLPTHPTFTSGLALFSPSGNQEQPEPHVEALLCPPSALLWGGPQHPNSGEELSLELLNGGQSPGGLILTWHLPPVLYIHTHLPPRCDAQTMTVMVRMTSLAPATPAWPRCKQPR